MLFYVSIFRTNILTEADKVKVMRQIQSFDSKLHVHIDLEDDEKIMRVAAASNITAPLKELLRESRYSCEELDSFYQGSSIYDS